MLQTALKRAEALRAIREQLLAPVSRLPGIGSLLAKGLREKGIENLKHLLCYFPRRYEARSTLLTLGEAIKEQARHPQALVTLLVKCTRQTRFSFRNREVKKYFFSDGALELSLAAFNPGHRFKVGEHYLLAGKIQKRYHEYELTLREQEPFDEEALNNFHLGKIVPIYSSLEKISQKKFRGLIKKALFHLRQQSEALTQLAATGEAAEATAQAVELLSYRFPAALMARYHFFPRVEALAEMHFPTSFDTLERARAGLVYEELFVFFKALAKRKRQQAKGKEKERYQKNSRLKQALTEVIKGLPFTLSKDQAVALKEILTELSGGKVMMRLLQGDVATGKTLVALLSMAYAALNGHQAALLAPTEILAQQHYATFKRFLPAAQFQVVLLLGAQKEKEKKHQLARLATETPLLAIGTHALLQKGVRFKQLKYVVIDEQHRFGVEQRQTLLSKATPKSKADFLSMSATPIPRSLSLMLFGEFEVSVLREKPAQQKQSGGLQTRVVTEAERPHAYKFLLSRIYRGEQGYVVFPVIEESSDARLRSLLQEYERLKRLVFKQVATGLIHGRLPAEEKEQILARFRAGELKALLATTVLEVGIDHPKATVMIIESAHQFGLSQLHQLRGRVGRGERQGYAYLSVPKVLAPPALERLKQFSQLQDGFAIAELDLKTRGPGDLIGTKQSGLPRFRLAELRRDRKLVLSAREEAFKAEAEEEAPSPAA